MRFLVDESTGPLVARWLRSLGHDVVSVYETLRGETDSEVLRAAVAGDRVLITNDKDFGELIFREGREHRGVVLLRLQDERPANKRRVLESLLGSGPDLIGRITVVTEAGIRSLGGAS